MWPFLIDNLKEVIRELQDFAEKKYNAEEAECPQRIARLSTVHSGLGTHNNINKQPRTLNDITNDKHIFIRIHMWLVWILSAGTRHFIEIFPISLSETEKSVTLVDAQLFADSGAKFQSTNLIPDFTKVSGKAVITILRELKNALGKEQFRQLLYSSLTGVQILVRGIQVQRFESLYGLSSLIPHACRRIQPDATEYLPPNQCNFIGVDTSIAIPMVCTTVCRLDIIAKPHELQTKHFYIVKWTGTLPQKLPTILTKIETTLENEKLGNSALQIRLAVLQQEWANIAKVVHAMRGRGHRSDIAELMLSLGAGPHDKKLLEAWSMGLPPNPA